MLHPPHRSNGVPFQVLDRVNSSQETDVLPGVRIRSLDLFHVSIKSKFTHGAGVKVPLPSHLHTHTRGDNITM